MKLSCQKHLFQMSEDIHYLNSAYKTPLLKSAEEAAISALNRSRNPQDILPSDFFSESKQVREEFANIINVPSKNIAIISSTSYGFASLFLNVNAKPKGKAITIGEEFPSGYFAVKKWCNTQDQKLQVISGDVNASQYAKDWNRRILEAIDDSTSVVCMSAIHWATGIKYDLKAIGAKCKLVGAKFLVDGAQTIGALPIDIQSCHIDGLVCAAYKCLYGPYSMSLMYVHDDFFGGIPLEEAWMNRKGAEEFSGLSDYNETYEQGARRFNMGQTSNFILTPILLEGLKQINHWGVSNIQSYCRSIAEPFMSEMTSIGYKFVEQQYLCYHLFSIKVNTDKIPEIKSALTKNNIKLSVRGTHIRISLSVFNTAADLEALAEVLRDFASIAKG